MEPSKNKMAQRIRNNKFIILFSFLIFNFSFLSAQDGTTIFKQKCSACHKIGEGRLVGPDLIGVTTKRSEDWLMKWTKSSSTLIASGDKDAI
ncbi:MAG: c-type cytochrome, partial [Bacteroidota bacterium]